MIPAAVLLVFIPDVKDMDLSNIQSLNHLVLPALIMFVFIIWFVALMFNAYKVCCNLKRHQIDNFVYRRTYFCGNYFQNFNFKNSFWIDDSACISFNHRSNGSDTINQL